MSDSMMKALAQAAREATQTATEIETLEEALSSKKMFLKNLISETIPSYMDALGCASFETADFEVSVKSDVKGTLPKGANHQRAIDWLNEHGGGEIIKTQIVIPFDKSQHNIACDLAGELEGKGYNATLGSTVHPQTLAAWGRERLKSGESFEPEIIGLFVERKAVVKIK